MGSREWGVGMVDCWLLEFSYQTTTNHQQSTNHKLSSLTKQPPTTNNQQITNLFFILRKQML
ncbi:MAG: hypothetical protein DSM106950_19425 [Stigonema ocellatum SAG 48.90 = DSM 106950]|nr:hypothetical protein [Stigonema ocellatum SAG 48.90 = DSM 106950]